MNKLTPMENQVIDRLLAGEDEVLSVLREQLRHAHVSAREMTGVGFFTTLYVPEETPRVANCLDFKLGDVIAKAQNVKHDLGFLLYIKNGALELLEGYTYDESWPSEVKDLSLAYSDGKTRDMEKLRKILYRR